MFANFVTNPRSRRAHRAAKWGSVVLVLAIALPIRVYLAVTAGMISRDGATFIWYAQDLAREPLAALRGHDQHPLYPALILAVHALLGHIHALAPGVSRLNDAVHTA